eukprot:scaffold47115_cov75-Phaeocystis_antarctica.AAC.2
MHAYAHVTCACACTCIYERAPVRPRLGALGADLVARDGEEGLQRLEALHRPAAVAVRGPGARGGACELLRREQGRGGVLHRAEPCVHATRALGLQRVPAEGRGDDEGVRVPRDAGGNLLSRDEQQRADALGCVDVLLRTAVEELARPRDEEEAALPVRAHRRALLEQVPLELRHQPLLRVAPPQGRRGPRHTRAPSP